MTNADLAFDSRRRAEQASGDGCGCSSVLDVATGILAARDGLDVETAPSWLHDAAVRAGSATLRTAVVLINVHHG